MLKYVNSAYALWMTLRLTCGVFQVLVCCYSWDVSSFFKHWIANNIWDLKFREKKSGKPLRSRKSWLPSRLILWDLFWFSLQNFSSWLFICLRSCSASLMLKTSISTLIHRNSPRIPLPLFHAFLLIVKVATYCYKQTRSLWVIIRLKSSQLRASFASVSYF